MFLSDTHERQRLAPACYFDAEFFDAEQEQLFRHSWQFVCTQKELAKDGDFVTRDILNTPILVRRDNGSLHGFINACAHRFAKLTDQPCGHSEKLTCQYHGWQYDVDGKTQRIPDAVSFKPLANTELGLKRIETTQIGPMVFAKIPKPDRTSAGEAATAFVEASADLVPASMLELHAENTLLPANWKVIVENAIESYHVGCVHADSFSIMPTAETCSHELHDDFTVFETTFPSQAAAILRYGERWIHRQLGVAHREHYEQRHLYPNLMLSASKIIAVMMLVEPVSPVSSRFHLRIFGNRGTRGGVLPSIAFRTAANWAVREVRRVLAEDFAVIPSIQQGLMSKVLPAGGLISVREERITHFQRKIQSALHDHVPERFYWTTNAGS
ncbi:MAG: aromatic ring-hydroxylating dioxygenase subunit alpha [Planctomycetota bacterium]